MGFSDADAPRAYAAREFKGVATAVSLVGSGDNRVPTVKVYVSGDILRECGMLIGSMVRITLGTGPDLGKVRFVRADDGYGDVKIRIETRPNVGMICSRLIPRGQGCIRRQTVAHSVPAPGVLEVVLPWLRLGDETPVRKMSGYAPVVGEEHE